MKKIIENVVNFPNGCETVRYTACFVSMLIKAERITNENCHYRHINVRQKGHCRDCNDCGHCKEVVPIKNLHSKIYNLYTAVTGFGFLQMDLSNDEHMKDSWNQTCNVMLRKFDWYIGFTMDYAGYDYEELIFHGENKDLIFSKIKSSIDKDIPLLALFGNLYQWVLITGYDDGGVLYGFDGSQDYWGKPYAEPAGYDENGLFIMPDWYEKGGHAFILGEKKETEEPAVTYDDMFRRMIRILEAMSKKEYFKRSAEYLRNDDNFKDYNEEKYKQLARRIDKFIGLPIDQRPVISWCFGTLAQSHELKDKWQYFKRISTLYDNTHDVCWIAWRMVGAFGAASPEDVAKALPNPVVRRVIADIIDIVRNNDELVLDCLREMMN